MILPHSKVYKQINRQQTQPKLSWLMTVRKWTWLVSIGALLNFWLLLNKKTKSAFHSTKQNFRKFLVTDRSTFSEIYVKQESVARVYQNFRKCLTGNFHSIWIFSRNFWKFRSNSSNLGNWTILGMSRNFRRTLPCNSPPFRKFRNFWRNRKRPRTQINLSARRSKLQLSLLVLSYFSDVSMVNSLQFFVQRSSENEQ